MTYYGQIDHEALRQELAKVALPEGWYLTGATGEITYHGEGEDVAGPIIEDHIAHYDEIVAKSKVPTSITKRQAKLQLLKLGYYDTVVAAISQLGTAAQIEWEDADFFERSNVLICSMEQLLGFTETDTDNFFIEASKI